MADDDIDANHLNESETESALGDNVSTGTASVSSSIYAHRVENGRLYHAYKDGKYFMPNDEIEQDRMDMQHHAIMLVLGSLYFSPLESPKRIIDLGTGTGIWAIEVADLHPESEVFGVDLSPIQPSWVPPNLRFQIDDVEDEWVWPDDHFDLIFSRLMISGSIEKLENYLKQIFQHLSPGGYFESHEVKIRIGNDSKEILEDDPLSLWCKYMRDSIVKMNRSLDPDLDDMVAAMRRIGFVDIVVRPWKLPLGTWENEEHLKKGGMAQLVALDVGLPSISLAAFTRLLGWTKEEVEVFLAQVRKDLKAKINDGFYFFGWVVYGKKPPIVASSSSNVT